MFARVIADRYARAVLNRCPDLATIERVKNDLALLGDTWDQSNDFRIFFMNPKMPGQIKVRILEASLAARLDPVTMDLVKLLVHRNRQNVLADIAIRFGELTDLIRGVEVAEVITAITVPPELAKKLVEAIQRFSSRTVEVRMMVDPRILGGVVVRLGDRVIDGSMKRRFDETRRALLATRLPLSLTDQS